MGSAVSMLCYVFPLFLPCSLTIFINTSFSKLTDCLSCFPLGRVLDMTVDLTCQSQASLPGRVCFLSELTCVCLPVSSDQDKAKTEGSSCACYLL